MRPEYARQYRELWERHWWWRSRERFVLGWIDQLHRRASLARILDVGCGDGLFFETLERFGRVEGLEPDCSLLSDGRWRERISVAPLDATFPRQSAYDLLLLLDVLEHIADDRGALEAAWATLRPGGYLLLTVPALPWLWSRHDEANAHHRRYLAGDLRGRLELAGFQVEQLRYFFFWTVLPLLARRWLMPARGGQSDYDVPIPSPAVNRTLTALSRCDHGWATWLRWPIGSSLLAIARRPEHPHGGAPILNPNFRGEPLLSAANPGK